MGMDFPIADLLDEDACYAWLVSALHPGGLRCPGCGGAEGPSGWRVHRRRRAPVIDHRCRSCGRVFNAFTGTALARTQRRPSQLVAVLRGLAKGEPTAAMAAELGCSRPHLHELRQRLQANAAAALWRADPAPLTGDRAAEADEMYQAAGEKRPAAHRPGRPAPAAGAQAQGARDVRQRPPAGPRGRRPGHRPAAAGGRRR